MPATLAILSIVFVESIYSAAGITDQADRIEHKLLSILILVVMSVANSISTKTSTRLNGFFVVTKFATIAAVVVAGLVVVIIQATRPSRDDVGGRDWFTKPVRDFLFLPQLGWIPGPMLPVPPTVAFWTPRNLWALCVSDLPGQNSANSQC